MEKSPKKETSSSHVNQHVETRTTTNHIAERAQVNSYGSQFADFSLMDLANQQLLNTPVFQHAQSLNTNQTQKGQEPILDKYKGTDINKSGKIASDTVNYQNAISSGMNIRSKPLAQKDLVLGKIKYGESVFVKATNITNEWYYVVSFNGVAGWINKNFVATDIPDLHSKLYHIQKGDELRFVLHDEYKDKYEIRPGDDLRALATAFWLANNGRSGVNINIGKFKESFQKNFLINSADPWNAFNRAIFESINIVSGTNVWLPSIEYVNRLKEKGELSTRPELVNNIVDIGKGIAGFIAGIFEGFFGAIVDALKGLWEIGKGIFNTIGKIISGEILQDINKIYNGIKNLTWDKVKEIAEKLLSAVVDGINAFKANWSDPDVYKRWNFRGKIVGNILLEVVLAVFTAGAGNALKWAGRLGKIAPKLSKIIMSAINKMDNVLPPRFKKNGAANKDKHDNSLDGNKDSNAFEKQKALVFAKTITEGHDAKDSSVETLRASLQIVKQKFRVVKGFEIIPKSQPGHYEVWMIASRHKVKEKYTSKNTQRGPSFLFSEIKRKWSETMTPADMKEIQKSVDRVKSKNPYYSNDGTEFKNSSLISPDAQRLNTSSTYTEWTVKTPGVGGRGKRRIVLDKKTGQAFYSHDHYDSYVEIDLSKWK